MNATTHDAALSTLRRVFGYEHFRPPQEDIVAQVIDDVSGRTLAAAASTEANLGGTGAKGNTATATEVGTQLAERAKAAGVTKVVFDRGGFQYHGRVAALADAARAAGLEF